MTGHVEDYTGRELIVRTRPGEPPRRFPISEVVEVTTDYTTHHNRARQLFAEGKITEAKVEFTAALNDENRAWVRREILASQVRCALWNGDYLAAVARFLPIAESDPETFHYDLVPLNWTDDPPAQSVRFDAREWISPASSSLSKLIGASWLLTSSDGSADAERTLKQLARDGNVRIQRLAQMQMWRLRLRKPEMIDPREISRWQHFVDGLPKELRGGAHFVIGQAWKGRQEHDRAARAYLWLPMVYDADRVLSSLACFEAAESLLLSGESTEAAKLYSEVVFRYGDTRWGAKAEEKWKLIRKTNTQSNLIPE